jgi:predicted phage tail protein
VRGNGLLPTTAASVDDGVIAFMNAALGLRFAAGFLAAFFGAAFFAGAFFAAGFFAADFFAAGFFAAGFFAGFFAFLAVAIALLPGG